MNNKTIKIQKDGNMWCAFREDFINIQESLIGYGSTEVKALRELMKEELTTHRNLIGLN